MLVLALEVPPIMIPEQQMVEQLMVEVQLETLEEQRMVAIPEKTLVEPMVLLEEALVEVQVETLEEQLMAAAMLIPAETTVVDSIKSTWQLKLHRRMTNGGRIPSS